MAADLDRQKKTVRETILARRAAIDPAAQEMAAAALAGRFFATFAIEAGTAISGFMPLPGEIDTVPLMARLHESGASVALPVCVARAAPLIFRAWHPGLDLVPDAFKIPAPPDGCEEIVPDMLIVPLAAFDRAGQRLGWGAGFYDRTLAGLRARKKITAIGAAFAAQEVDSVPHGAHDQPLDWVLTEREAIRTGAAI